MIKDQIWTEKYRPSKLEDIILNNKTLFNNYISNKETLPSFIFYGSKPGCGKTSLAYVLINELESDHLLINASDERGIDVIREKIVTFSTTMSLNGNKKCIFLDEADGLTKIALDSLRNIMETYSSNCFFILSCNDISKIIEPIRSRCVTINFENPNKADIIQRINKICELEEIKVSDQEIEKLVEDNYPDIRSMINKLQIFKIDNVPLTFNENSFANFSTFIVNKDIKKIYETVYSGNFEIMSFNKWFFHKIFEQHSKLGLEKASKIAMLLADTEKSWSIGANLEIIFIANILEISKIL